MKIEKSFDKIKNAALKSKCRKEFIRKLFNKNNEE